jgi:hypothetical protein
MTTTMASWLAGLAMVCPFSRTNTHARGQAVRLSPSPNAWLHATECNRAAAFSQVSG